MRPRGLSTTLVVAVAMGVAACSVATPTTTPIASRDGAVPSFGSMNPIPPSSASLASAPPGLVLSDYGRTLEFGSVDAGFSSRVLEFASTGSAIIASAGPDTDSSPDLYSVLPGSSEPPSLLWRNTERDHSIVKMAGDGDTIAFVDMAVEGETGWTLQLIPDAGEEALVLDDYHGDSEAAALVPSFSVYWPYVAWTAFEVGPSGTNSQLLVAEYPDWNPRVITERPAADAELWFPYVYGSSLLYTELVYSVDHQSDERSVWLTDVQGNDPERLDTTGLATMPVMNQYGIAWKEGDPGFHMLNWGVMEAYDAAAGSTLPVTDTSANFPSSGERYMTWWLADPTRLEMWDTRRNLTREILRYEDSARRIRRPTIGGDLLAWLVIDESVDPIRSELRYAFLP